MLSDILLNVINNYISNKTPSFIIIITIYSVSVQFYHVNIKKMWFPVLLKPTLK